MITQSMRRRAWAALALCATGATVAQNTPAPQPAPQAALTVTVTTASASEWPQRLSANGSIAAWQEASVGVEFGGLRLTEVPVQVGDAVQRGQVLARFNAVTVESEVEQARAALAEAQAAAGEAQANAQRARQLGEAGMMSPQQVAQALTAENTAAARVASARAALSHQQIRLQQTELKAPDAGVISARSATVGAVVNSGQELFRLIRRNRLEWRAEVPAADLARLKPGQAVQVTPAGGGTVNGRVRSVAPTVDPATRIGIVYVDLPLPGDARAGMYARGDFELGRSRALSLPQAALQLRDGFSYVFQLGADQRVKRLKVNTGRRQGDRVEILDGLPPDARVVASGAGFLSDGDRVRVVEADARTDLRP